MAASGERMFGIDFSGAAEPAASIWITEATKHREDRQVVRCDPAWARLELPRTADRARVYEALRTFITAHPAAVFGVDFPFGLPAPILGAVDTWEEHLQTFETRFETATADAFRQSCVERAETRAADGNLYQRRETDMRYAAQCPYLPQIQYQTLYGQSRLLKPLVAGDLVRVAPMQAPMDGLPTVIEIYPAATLGVLRLHRQGYKTHPDSQRRRDRILEGVRSRGYHVPAECREPVQASHDALDSVLAAIGVFHAINHDFAVVDEAASIEGQIFA